MIIAGKAHDFTKNDLMLIIDFKLLAGELFGYIPRNWHGVHVIYGQIFSD